MLGVPVRPSRPGALCWGVRKGKLGARAGRLRMTDIESLPRFLARRQLLRPERISQPRLRRTRLQRLLLTLMRCPARQKDNVERGHKACVAVGEPFRIFAGDR